MSLEKIGSKKAGRTGHFQTYKINNEPTGKMKVSK